MLFAALYLGKYRAHYAGAAHVYARGSWRMAPSLPYEAELCFLLMQSEFPTAGRTFGASSQIVRLILSSGAVLGGPSDGLGRNRTGAIWHIESAKPCDSMFRNFADPGRGKVVFTNFPNWASGPYRQSMGGIDFGKKIFAGAAEVGGRWKFRRSRLDKSPGHNCYTSIPTQIQFRAPPHGSIRRMRNFPRSTFDCTEGALDILLSHMDIADASIRGPEVILVSAGPGGAGKTLLIRDLMGAFLGIGHMVAPPPILQTPGEFRKKGHIYCGPKWISIDEGRPALGSGEDVFRIFDPGGSPWLRKNHEPETLFADWPRCGGSWSLNPDDVPHVQSATESAYRRMIRCVRMRARFPAKA